MRTMCRTRRAAIVLALGVALTGAAAATVQNVVLTNSELRLLGASANTAAQHRRLVAHYHMRAAEHHADAKAHEAIARMAEARTSDKHSTQLALNARHYAQYCTEAAEVAEKLASLHEALATRSAK